ncbi:uncharacterized protein LOC122850687 [Aphidius gifuensis]|uniref:uncharacterized protein LOC122850687 n=1 Tax=Aphidius gifuensis TaxID=684658 RepID=UPI001CDCF913|nr:uncharacterized protein LOC122850687 [Aphidius gifuensis]
MSQIKRLHEPEWNKNLVKKKCKVTRQIITRSISKINNKINCHHDDDLYAKDKLLIERVNEYCLAEIFMYIPACERPKFALVCKQWKRALDYYSWSNVTKLELTHWEFDEYPNYLIKHYPTLDRQFNFLKSLLDKCGRYLTELDATAYGHCNIVPVINESCPNLVKLRIRIKYIEDAILDNAFTSLSKLKVLKIIFQCFSSPGTDVPLTLLNSLLNVADTLTELSLSNWSRCIADNAIIPDEFTSVVTELKALRQTQIGGMICSNTLVDNMLALDPAMIRRYDECKYRGNIIDRTNAFEYIKRLTIQRFRVADDFLYNIANVMRRLHTLQIYCHWVTDAVFQVSGSLAIIINRVNMRL